MKLFICEKPSVAASLASCFGARKSESHYEADGVRITWCIGHLLGLYLPEDYDAKYGSPWRWDVLPIVPRPFRLSPGRGVGGQLKAIGKLLKSCSTVVIATDPEREGEMIGREVLEYHGYEGPTQRMWTSAMDPQGLKDALATVMDGEKTIGLYYAGRARSEADWLIGMNMTRAMTLKSPRGSGLVSVGRVQTPTLALVVRRDREIANFKPQDYYELAAQVRAGAHEVTLRFSPPPEKRILDRGQIERLRESCLGKEDALGVVTERKYTSPPKLFSLSGLQKRADTLWGWPAKKTLKIAQALYETHKATTYPRTNCEYLRDEHVQDIPVISAHLFELPEFAHLRGFGLTPRKNVFNSKKVGAHFAIIPTKQSADVRAMSADERKAYVLIASHYLGALLPDYEYDSTVISMIVAPDLALKATGTVPMVPGWRVALESQGTEGEDREQKLPPIKDGELGRVESCDIAGKKTKAPPRYAEGTLIGDMENVSKYVEDADKRAILDSEENNKQRGIGTEATRADIIANLRDREFIETVKGRYLQATPKAHAFIEFVEKELPALADPVETANWEEQLEAVANSQKRGSEVVEEIVRKVSEYLRVLEKRPTPSSAGDAANAPTGKSTGILIPAYADGAEVELINHGDCYLAAGWPGRFFREIAKRSIKPEEYRALVLDWKSDRKGVQFAGFTSKAGRPFSARLLFDGGAKPYPKTEMRFND